MRKKRKTRNSLARALGDPLFRQRVVRPKKGRGSYKRKGRFGKKHRPFFIARRALVLTRRVF